ncbi:unnamed protein product [Coregonus sp. 'balchen']|nr:unnamed protein product [Coregonus sp. 'balchen']
MEMSEDIYANMDIVLENMFCNKRATSRDEVIYDDIINSHKTPGSNPSGSESLGLRSFRAAAVCLGLLCVLLLAGIIGLGFYHKTVVVGFEDYKASKNNLTIEKEELQTRYNTVAKERDELQTSNKKLTTERDQLQNNYNAMKGERDGALSNYNNYLSYFRKEGSKMRISMKMPYSLKTQETRPRRMPPLRGRSDNTGRRPSRAAAVCLGLLCVLLLAGIVGLGLHHKNVISGKGSHSKLAKMKDQLQTSFSTMTMERDQLQTSFSTMTMERDQLQTGYNNLTEERDLLKRERDFRIDFLP